VSRDELVRHVLEHAADGSARVVRDRGVRLPGRGAWLHDSEQCRQLATKRRAFRRALRVAGDIDFQDITDNEAAGHVTSPD
jgi:predicted RNA-binding protein YlxR (DUF448 family)